MNKRLLEILDQHRSAISPYLHEMGDEDYMFWKPYLVTVDRQRLFLENKIGIHSDPQHDVTDLNSKMRFLSGAKAYAAKLGKKEGWAFYLFRDRFGEEPSHEIWKRAEPKETPIVDAYLKAEWQRKKEEGIV